uniref:Threonylcarbamoyl-AMP synthase n=1 Tax=Oreochromis niloticus TaxID=8128 RepID=A0A669ESF1_ORENI
MKLTLCSFSNSRLTSGLLKIAGILEQGGVCGIPTDTVYALAASCKNPQAIEKIYNIKDRPAEKPICICISSVEQLVRKYGVTGICVIYQHSPQFNLSVIMIRVPDHTVTGHLCNITGPLAITSANPSGEADSTHHSMHHLTLAYLTLSAGTITLVREGCVPAVKVYQIFERVKSTML